MNETGENTLKYGCFTTVRAERLPDGGVGVRGWERHVARLRRDTEALYGVPVATSAIVAALHAGVAEAIAAGHTLPRLVRIAAEPDRLDLAGDLSVTTRDVAPTNEPIRVQPIRHDRLRPEMKHTYTAPEFAARDAAVAAGYDDALLVGPDGSLREGTTWTLLLGRADGSWVSPAADVLPSVTLSLLADALEVSVEPVAAANLPDFVAAAALGSGRGVSAIASIDDVAFTGSVEAVVSAYARVGIDPVGDVAVPGPPA